MMASHLPALVVIGRFVNEPESADEEALCAHRLLDRALPPATRIDSPANDWPSLVAAAVCGAVRAGLGERSMVLLLAHRHASPAPDMVRRLAAVLDQGASAACARTQHCPPPEAPPDYLTLRGMERYAQHLADQSVAPCRFDARQPFAVLATVGDLRSGAWMQAAAWAPGAYFHDFSGYRGGRREEIIPLVPATARRVLDVGGGEGGFLAALKAMRGEHACETHLAEFSAPACRIAAGVVDRVWQGDFLSLPLPVGFDCITFLDVLEHATHPVAWLARARELLAPDGAVVLSIPNVGHWSVVADLLEGRWDYAPAGIHCITHLRFFTRTGVCDLLREAGFAPERIEAQRIDPPHWFDIPAMGHALAIDTDSLATYAFLAVARVSR